MHGAAIYHGMGKSGALVHHGRQDGYSLSFQCCPRFIGQLALWRGVEDHIGFFIRGGDNGNG